MHQTTPMCFLSCRVAWNRYSVMCKWFSTLCLQIMIYNFIVIVKRFDQYPPTISNHHMSTGIDATAALTLWFTILAYTELFWKLKKYVRLQVWKANEQSLVHQQLDFCFEVHENQNFMPDLSISVEDPFLSPHHCQEHSAWVFTQIGFSNRCKLKQNLHRKIHWWQSQCVRVKFMYNIIWIETLGRKPKGTALTDAKCTLSW